MPDVAHRHARLRHHHGAIERLAVVRHAQAAVRLDDHAVPADPGRMAEPAGEAPGAGHPVAAVDRHRPRLAVGRAPGQDGARIAEHIARHVRRHVGGRHRAAGTLHDAPPGAGIGLGNLLDCLQVGRPVPVRSRRTIAAAACGTIAPRAARRAPRVRCCARPRSRWRAPRSTAQAAGPAQCIAAPASSSSHSSGRTRFNIRQFTCVVTGIVAHSTGRSMPRRRNEARHRAIATRPDLCDKRSRQTFETEG